MSGKSYGVGLAMAVTAAGAIGCSAPGYRPNLYAEQFKEDNAVVDNLRSRVAKVEYGSDISTFARLQFAITAPGAPILKQDADLKILFGNYVSGVIPPAAKDSDKKNLATLIKQQNKLAAKLFKDRLLPRWLVSRASRIGDLDLGVALKGEEEAEVAEVLSKIDLTRVSYKSRQALANYKSSDLKYNELALSYIVKVLAADADVQMLEGNIPQMAANYERIRKIELSLGRDYSVKTNPRVATALRLPVSYLPERHPFRERYSLDALNKRLEKPVKSLEELPIWLAINAAIADFTDQLARITYSDRHDALHGPGLAMLSLPLVLPGLDEHDSIVLKRFIIGKLGEAYAATKTPGEADLINGLDLTLLSLPGFGPIYAVASGAVREALTPNEFTLKSSESVDRFAELLEEGNRMSWGDGTAEHFVGDNFTARLGIPIGIATTGAAVAGFVGGGGGGGGGVLPPEPPVGGGGPIQPPF